MIFFNYYDSNIFKSIPIGQITLDRFIDVVRNPKPETKELFEQIRIATENKDQALRSSLKTKLYYFTPCVLVNGQRKYDNITSFTGLLALDFDKLKPDYCIEFKQYLFDTYEFIIATWLSTSKHGVRALVSIPVCVTVGEFKEYFSAIENQFLYYKGFDKSTKNCILPMFLSYDENILFRTSYSTWTKRIIEPIKPIIKQYIISDQSKRIEQIIKSSIDKINDNGHPQLRATAFSIGGYVGGGYLDTETAIDIMDRLIDSNHYLSQKASIYKKTSRTMINKGVSVPLYIK